MSVFRGEAGAAKDIDARRHQLKVRWIAAGRPTAKVVKMLSSGIKGHRPDKPSIEQAVGKHQLIAQAGASMPLPPACGAPEPAGASVPNNVRMNADFAEDSLDVFLGQVFYGKVFVSHINLLTDWVVRLVRAFAAPCRAVSILTQLVMKEVA